VSEIKKPVKKTLTDYFYNGASKDSIVTSTEYSFAGLNRTNAPHTFQTSTKVVNSNRDTVCSETRYLTDILEMSGSNTVYKQMYDRNMIAVPLETIRKNKNGIVEAQVNLYRQYTTGNIVPAEQKTLEATYPIANYQNLSLATSETMDSRLTTNIKFERFDNKGLLTQYTKRNQITTVTLWGYNGQYPIAKIEGANYDDVKAILTQSLIDKLSISVSPNIVDLGHRLRSGLASKTASIYTYTYRPLVGMTSSTDPRGITTYYDYDAFNRLKRTYIKENNVEKTVQSYDYHYQGQ
jgi:YD repeat-containing protein